MKKIALAVAAFGLIGAGARAEEYPRPINDLEKANIRKAITKKLIDPGSAQFRWNPNFLNSVTYCGFVNSKNRMGGYVGFSAFKVIMKPDREIVISDIASTPTATSTYVVEKTCADDGYNLDPANPKTIDD